MKNALIVISLLLLVFALRLHNYAIYPQRGATSDEYAFAFQGISLLTQGAPVAWSAIPLYKDVRHLTIDGLYFPIVRPYLDHPPLFGLLIGGWAVVARETTFEAVRLATIRVVPIVLSFISAVFLYLLARGVYGEQVARWSLTIYATATIFVVNGRVVVAESLLTPFLLAAIWMTSRMSKKSMRLVVFVGLLSAAAILTKALGVVVWLSVIAILIYRKASVKQVVMVTGMALCGITAWYLYGRAFDEQLFWSIQSYQGMSRVLGPNTIWMMLGVPSIVNKMYYDSWYFWGLFALAVASLDMRKNVFIVLPAFLYVLLLIVSVNETDIHGWYFLPLFPFLAIAGGKLLIESIEKASWAFLIWAVLVGANLIQELYAVPFGLTPSIYRWLVGIILVGAFVALRSKRVGYGMVLLFIVGTGVATLRYVHPA